MRQTISFRVGKLALDFKKSFLDSAFPPHCITCETIILKARRKFLLCPFCRDSLPLISGPVCDQCGAPLPEHSQAQGSCFSCSGRKLYFDSAICVGIYKGLLRKLVLRAKDSKYEHMAAVLAKLAWEETGGRLQLEKPDIIVPIPMHWRRRALRGVNSAELLAKTIAMNLHIPTKKRLLQRCKNTPPQAGLPQKERFSNVRGAFMQRRGYALKAAHVLLVDDILTTGATSSEAARILKSNGAKRVTVLAVARSLPANTT